MSYPGYSSIFNARAINFTSDTAYPAVRVKPNKSRKKITNNLAT